MRNAWNYKDSRPRKEGAENRNTKKMVRETRPLKRKRVGTRTNINAPVTRGGGEQVRKEVEEIEKAGREKPQKKIPLGISKGLPFPVFNTG